MATPKKKPAPAKRVSVKLLEAHTHSGHAHEAGDDIDVAETLLPWLRNQGLIAKENG